MGHTIGKILFKLAVSIAITVFFWKKVPDAFQRMAESMSADMGPILGALGAAFVVLWLVAVLYTAFTIFWFCFTNENFVLLVNGLPIPFLLKIVAGFAGIGLWVWLLFFLDKQFGQAAWFNTFVMLLYLPMFFWIDIVRLILSIRSSRQEAKLMAAFQEDNSQAM